MNSRKIILYVSLAIFSVIVTALKLQSLLFGIAILGLITGGGVSFGGMMIYYRRLDQTNSQLQQQLVTYQQYDQVNQQLPRLQSRYSDLETQHQQLEKQYQETKDNLAQINQEIAGRREHLNQVNRSLEDSEQRRETQQQALNQLEKRIAGLNQDYPNLSEKEALQQQIQELRSNRSGLQGEVESLQQQIDRTIQEREQEIQRTQSLLQPLNEEIQQLEDRRNQQQENLNNLEERIASLNQDYPNLSEKEELRQEIHRLRFDRSGLQGKMESLQQQTEQKRGYLDNLETQLDNLKNQLSESELTLTQQQARQQSLTEEVEQLQQRKQELDQTTTDLEFLRGTYDRLDTERKEHENRISELRPEIERLEAERNRILQEIQNNQPDYHEIQAYKKQIEALKWEIREKESRVRELDSEISQLETMKNSWNEQVIRLQKEEKVLEKRLAQLKGEISAIEESSEQALKSLKTNLWSMERLPKTPTIIESETQFITNFANFLNHQGLSFPSRAIKSFHTSLKVQDISALAILAGISGTGKSELPRQYANFIGAQFLMLPVQPRWDSPQDLLGFYNYVEQKYKPTDLMRGLYQFNHQEALQNRLVIVLLDEMNLARVEYYFSEFLSKLETRRSQNTYLDIDVGSLPLPEEERRVKLPEQFLFVGTMNEDETTQSLSDKVLDRANVLTFGKPYQLQLKEESNHNNSAPTEYLTYDNFQQWIKQPHENDEVVEAVREYIDQTNQVMEKMGYSFGHRVYQAITKYVVNYPGVEDSNSAEFKSAIADQFGQKILPKLRGLMVDEAKSELNELQQILQETEDNSLIHAFENARNGQFGQFQWRGLVYEERGESQ